MKTRPTGASGALPALFAASAFAWVASACGNVTVGGFTEVDVTVSGNDTTAPGAPLGSAAFSILPFPSGSNQPEGEMELDMSLDLVSEAGSAIRLGDDEIRVKVDLEGQSRAEAVKGQLVEATRYTELRITFRNIKVEVSGGLVIGGDSIMGEVHVEIQDTALVVPRALNLDAKAGDRVALTVDLNAPAWLEALDPDSLTIDEAVFANLIDVVIQ